MNSKVDESIADRQLRRFQVLQWFYNKANDQRMRWYEMRDVMQDLDLSGEESVNIKTYLCDEGLLETRGEGGGLVRISHRGYKEVEEKLLNPDRPTEHFSINVINVQNMVGSQIQQGTIHSHQTGTFQQADRAMVTDIIEQIRAILPDTRLPDEDREELQSELDTMDVQLRSPRPKRPIINACLESVKAILVGAAGNLLADPPKLQAIITAIEKAVGVG